MSRQGIHRDDKYRVQAYYTATEKGLFVLVAKREGVTLTEAIRRAFLARARGMGIVDENDMITKDFKDAIAIEAAIVEQSEMKGKKNANH